MPVLPGLRVTARDQTLPRVSVMAGEANAFDAEELTPTTIKLFLVTLPEKATASVVPPEPVFAASWTTVIGGPPKVKDVGERLTAGARAAVAVPEREMVWGLPVALSVTVTVPGWLPVAVGVKVTLMEQLAPAATDVPQVLVWAYGALATIRVMLSDALPELVRVMDCAALVVFTF